MDFVTVKEVRDIRDDGSLSTTEILLPVNRCAEVYGVSIEGLRQACPLAVSDAVTYPNIIQRHPSETLRTLGAGDKLPVRLTNIFNSALDVYNVTRDLVCDVTTVIESLFTPHAFVGRRSTYVGGRSGGAGASGRWVTWEDGIYQQVLSTLDTHGKLWDLYRNALYLYQAWLPCWAWHVHEEGRIAGSFPEIDLSSFLIVEEGNGVAYYKTPFVGSPSYNGECLASHPRHLEFYYGLVNGVGFRWEWTQWDMTPSSRHNDFLRIKPPESGRVSPFCGVILTTLSLGVFGLKWHKDN